MCKGLLGSPILLLGVLTGLTEDLSLEHTGNYFQREGPPKFTKILALVGQEVSKGRDFSQLNNF